MAFTKINAAGIGTTETVTVDGLTVINNGSFGGNLTVSGVLTYEDVTNVDSIGIITARAGVLVGSGITLSKDGDGFFTGVCTATSFVGDGSALTGITQTTINNNANNRIITGSGTANTLEAESTLTYDGTNLDLGDDKKIRLGAGQDLQIYHDGSSSIIRNYNTSAPIYIQPADSETGIKLIANGAVELYYDNSKTFETISGGAALTGTLTATGQLTGNSSNSGKYVRLYGGAGTGRWDIYGHGANLRISDNDSTGSVVVDRAVSLTDSVKAQFGASNDLEIFHDGSNSYVRETGTGSLFIEGNSNIYIGKASGGAENCIVAEPDGTVQLYWDNAKKYETQEVGANIFGRSVDCQIRFKTSDGTTRGSIYAYQDNTIALLDASGNYSLRTNSDKSTTFFNHAKPNADNSYDLGTTALRWRNLYTTDLHLSNKGKTNDVDGTWGDWTLQEGENDIFMINNRTGKKFTITMREVS